MEKFFESLMSMFSMFIAQFVTNANQNDRISRWYHMNGHYKFPVGAIVALISFRTPRYGIRPIGTVKGYTNRGGYILDMTIEEKGNAVDYIEWIEGKYVPSNKRIFSKEVHMKWAIENHFKEVACLDPNIAYNVNRK